MDIDWQSVAAGAGMTVLAHPFTYVKVLIQLGHEPLAPVMGRNMFFRKQLQYPGVFEYMKHIRKTDGFLGLYRGVGPRICANLSTSLTYSAVGQALKKVNVSDCMMTNMYSFIVSNQLCIFFTPSSSMLCLPIFHLFTSAPSTN
uniref:Mitochondrial carrier homolog 2 n=1 Tax=Phallusia mammillata TaxID=59560 RepID=A0A6F9DKS2_9ASCI|nr:mitochondrial carrier homolog 2 [Phallusia mammillata]